MATAAVRKSAVAGLFYPGSKDELYKEIEELLKDAPLYSHKPEALISPHAGYIYSGRTAAVSYKQLLNLEKSRGYTFLLLGPSHYVYLRGVSFSYYDYWSTPLGEVKVNKNRIEQFIEDNPSLPITLSSVPHQREHSLEVQIPFIQVMMDKFDIIPVVYGDVKSLVIKTIIDYFKDENTVVIISSDLSHYYQDSVARVLDSNCHKAVEMLSVEQLNGCEACGKIGIEGMILYGKENDLKAKLLDYRTSGDSSGDYSMVVGYGSYIFYK